MLGVAKLKHFPGTEKLKCGWKTTGFYGELPGEDLITYPDLIKRVGLTEGTPHNEDQGWLVFDNDQKPLYVSKRTLMHSVSYTALAAAGLVCGSTDITIGDFCYRIRLITNKEWNRFMYPIHVDDPFNWGWGINYTDADLGIGERKGGASWVQSNDPDLTKDQLTRGFDEVTSWFSAHASFSVSSLGCRVVLESIETPTEHTPLRSDSEIPVELGKVYKKLKHHHHELEVVLGMAEGPLQDDNVPTLLSELIAECSWLEHHIRTKTERIEEARNRLLGLRTFMQEYDIK